MVMKQKADYEPLAKEAYMMEFNSTEELNKLPSPRYHVRLKITEFGRFALFSPLKCMVN